MLKTKLINTQYDRVRINEDRKLITTTNEYDEENESICVPRRRSHTSDNFIRYQELNDDRWENRNTFLWCFILVGTGNDVFPMCLDLILTHSGGVSIFLFPLCMILFGMPMIYMEIYLGKYTKVTNCQMYRMAPIFFGFCFTIFLLNLMYQPLHISEETPVLVSLLKLLVNPSVNDKCLKSVDECYDYKTKGPLTSQNCTAGHMSMMCNNKTIRYPMQYMYWAVYHDATSGFYPYWQLVTAVVISWAVITGVIIKGIKLLGRLVKSAFVFHIVMLTMIFIIALANNGVDGLTLITTIDTSRITWRTLTVMIWISLFRSGIIIPSGFMTGGTYSKFRSNIASDSFIIISGSVFLWFYYLLAYCAIAGAIAKPLGVKPEAVLLINHGLFVAMVPEMLNYVGDSNLLLILYFLSAWIFETIKIALYIHMLILNMFDYFPLTKKFTTYIWTTTCITLCFFSILYCNLQVYQFFISTFWSVLMLFGLGMLVATEGVMVFYIYGVKRLSDDIYFVKGNPPFQFWITMWYIIPAFFWVLCIIIVFTLNDSKYTTWFLYNNQIEWISITILLGTVLTVMIVATIMLITIKIDTPNLLSYLFKPQFFWGSPDSEIRKQRKVFRPQTYIRSQQSNTTYYKDPNQESYEKNPDSYLKLEKIFNDKIFFNSIGIFSEDMIKPTSRINKEL